VTRVSQRAFARVLGVFGVRVGAGGAARIGDVAVDIIDDPGRIAEADLAILDR
jgi:hypothetical protein